MTDPRFISLHIREIISSLTEFGTTYASDYDASGIPDIAAYRRSLILRAETAETNRCEALRRIPGRCVIRQDIRGLAFSYLRAMSRNDKWAESYTDGIKRPFPADVIDMALSDISKM